MATWLEDVRNALESLGGTASLTEIYAEVQQSRIEPFPTTWQATIGSIDDHNDELN